MDITYLAAILVLIVNLNLNAILAFPQQASILESNSQSSSAQKGYRNTNSNYPYGYSADDGIKGLSDIAPSSAVVVEAQPQGLNINNPHYGHGHSHPDSDDLQERIPSALIRLRRSYDQARAIPARPSSVEELATLLLLSKEIKKGQNMDTFFHLLSLLTAKPEEYPATDFPEEDDLEPIDLQYGKRPKSQPVSILSNKGKDSYLEDDVPMANMYSNHRGGRLKKTQKKQDLGSGRLYSLGQLLENSQDLDPSVPVYRRPII